MSKRIFLSVVVVGSLFSGVANAQNELEQAASSLLGTSVSVTGVLTTSSVIILVLTLTGGVRAELLEKYLNDNRAEVLANLSLGGGESANDLAALFGVPVAHRSRFAAALRSHRSSLRTALGSARVDRALAHEFAQHILKLMRQDEVLRKDLPPALREG